jgi:hypothetical protein
MAVGTGTGDEIPMPSGQNEKSQGARKFVQAHTSESMFGSNGLRVSMKGTTSVTSNSSRECPGLSLRRH